MKKVAKQILKHLSNYAFHTAAVTVNQVSRNGLYQPKLPEKLNNYRKLK